MKKWLLPVALSLLLSGAVFFNRQGHRLTAAGESQNPLYFVPQASMVRPFLLGFDQVAADLIWLRALGYSADEMLAHGSLRFIEPLADLIVSLDPRFEKAYLWGSVILVYGSGAPTIKEVNASNRLLKRGIAVLQSIDYWPATRFTWRLPFNIAFNYWSEAGDVVRGAYYLRQAASFPSAPAFIRTLPATLLMKQGMKGEAIDIIRDHLMVESIRNRLDLTENEEEKKQLWGLLRYYLRRAGLGEGKLQRYLAQNRELERIAQQYRERVPYLPFGQYLAYAGKEEGEKEAAPLFEFPATLVSPGEVH